MSIWSVCTIATQCWDIPRISGADSAEVDRDDKVTPSQRRQRDVQCTALPFQLIFD